MPEIISIHAREILDSRGNPTVEAEVTTIAGITARAVVPSAASTGEHKMLELRDDNKKRYNGKGVETAVRNVLHKIAPEIIGMDCRNQRDIDFAMIELDGAANKGKLGAVATNCGQIKSGSLSRTDRLAKYNQLMRIEEELGDAACYRGMGAFYNLKKKTAGGKKK